MAGPITLTAQADQIARILAQLGSEQVPTATMRALNRTAQQILTVSRRTAAKEMGISQTKLQDERGGPAFSLQRATRQTLVAVIIARGKHLRLVQFSGTRQTKKGVTSSAWGTRKLYPGTFMSTMPTGFVGAFDRKGGKRGQRRRVKAGKNIGKAYRPELPLKDLWGPSLPKTMAEKDVVDAVETTFATRMPINLDHEVSAILRRYTSA